MDVILGAVATCVLIISVVALLPTGNTARASGTATLTGMVADSAGRPLKGAQVTLSGNGVTTQGSGPETIRLVRLMPGVYWCSVYQWSSDGSLALSRAKVEARLGGHRLALTVPSGAGRWWHVFSYDSTNGRFDITNEINNQALPGLPG